ncbi:DUF1501 domain-containing protein [Singulisphaera sp. Ch08]|uniref:DUF1501 domain-containing protein n=1 Tax=Singulisphaera sp. Ch08 TaxID=3120278 RepID=A0AAU7C6H1_9BACT
MLSFEAGSGVRLCDGLTRREALRIGGLALGGLTLPALLSREAAAKAAAPGGKGARAKSVIVFCTNGGTAQIDSFDPKPDAPAEVRGEFGSTATSMPGVLLNEHLPHLAKLQHKTALLRAVYHDQVLHPEAIYLSLCGAKITRVVTPESATMSREDRPHFGSVASKLLPSKPDLPGFVMLPEAMGPNGPEWPGQFAGFLGSAYDPYRINSFPGTPAYSPGALAADVSLPSNRVHARRSLREQLSQAASYLERAAATKALDPHFVKAFDVISSSAARQAFDVEAEPEAIRKRYGNHYFGQSCLLARRLVESGVRLVQINWLRSNIGEPVGPGYDTHGNHFSTVKDKLYPATDQAFSTLIEDLDERGLLDETLVVFHNEFGRTPKINANAGRDHWPSCYSVLLAGGGIQRGVVHGESDRIGAYPTAGAVTPQDVLATIYHLLGIDLDETIRDHLNRPHRLVEGEPIQAIL